MLTPNPQRFVDTKGREIEGLPSRPERFVRLVPKTDFVVVDRRKTVVSNRTPEEFALFISPSAGGETHVIDAPHWRSITVDAGDKPIVATSRGTKKEPLAHYYAVNVKGAGFLKPTLEGIDFEKYDSWTALKTNENSHRIIHWVERRRNEEDSMTTMMLGLAAEEDFLGEYDVMFQSQFLVEQGLRCELYWTINKLLRLPFKGEMMPIEELARREVIPREEQPHQAVRLFRTNTRIEEVFEDGTRRQEIFKRAFETFNRETKDTGSSFPTLDIANPEHQRLWFQEFFRRMGSNLAVLINAGMSHAHLHSSNVTMAAEIADLESLWDIRCPDPDGADDNVIGGVDRLVLKDMRDVAYSCRALVRAGRVAELETGNAEDLVTAVLDGFSAVLKPDMLTTQNIPVNPKSAAYWLKEIFTKAVVREKRLISLLRGTVEDWGIPNPI